MRRRFLADGIQRTISERSAVASCRLLSFDSLSRSLLIGSTASSRLTRQIHLRVLRVLVFRCQWRAAG